MDRNQTIFTAEKTDAIPKEKPEAPFSFGGGETEALPLREIRRTEERSARPILPAVVMGIAAAGLLAGIRAAENIAHITDEKLAEKLLGLLPEGVKLLPGMGESLVQGIVAAGLLLLLMGMGFSAVGQPGILALLFLRSVGTGAAIRAMLPGTGLPEVSDLLPLIPQMLTLGMLLTGGILSIRMANDLFLRLRDEKGRVNPLHYTLLMAAIGTGILLLWFLWGKQAG